MPGEFSNPPDPQNDVLNPDNWVKEIPEPELGSPLNPKEKDFDAFFRYETWKTNVRPPKNFRPKGLSSWDEALNAAHQLKTQGQNEQAAELLRVERIKRVADSVVVRMSEVQELASVVNKPLEDDDRNRILNMLCIASAGDTLTPQGEAIIRRIFIDNPGRSLSEEENYHHGLKKLALHEVSGFIGTPEQRTMLIEGITNQAIRELTYKHPEPVELIDLLDSSNQIQKGQAEALIQRVGPHLFRTTFMRLVNFIGCADPQDRKALFETYERWSNNQATQALKNQLGVEAFEEMMQRKYPTFDASDEESKPGA